MEKGDPSVPEALSHNTSARGPSTRSKISPACPEPPSHQLKRPGKTYQVSTGIKLARTEVDEVTESLLRLPGFEELQQAKPPTASPLVPSELNIHWTDRQTKLRNWRLKQGEKSSHESVEQQGKGDDASSASGESDRGSIEQAKDGQVALAEAEPDDAKLGQARVMVRGEAQEEHSEYKESTCVEGSKPEQEREAGLEIDINEKAVESEESEENESEENESERDVLYRDKVERGRLVGGDDAELEVVQEDEADCKMAKEADVDRKLEKRDGTHGRMQQENTPESGMFMELESQPENETQEGALHELVMRMTKDIESLVQKEIGNKFQASRKDYQMEHRMMQFTGTPHGQESNKTKGAERESGQIGDGVIPKIVTPEGQLVCVSRELQTDHLAPTLIMRNERHAEENEPGTEIKDTSDMAAVEEDIVMLEVEPELLEIARNELERAPPHHPGAANQQSGVCSGEAQQVSTGHEGVVDGVVEPHRNYCHCQVDSDTEVVNEVKEEDSNEEDMAEQEGYQRDQVTEGAMVAEVKGEDAEEQQRGTVVEVQMDDEQEGDEEASDDEIEVEIELGQCSVEDAVAYVGDIKDAYKDEPETFNSFLRCLRAYKQKKVSLDDTINQVGMLFAENPQLIQGFEHFLVPGMQHARTTISDASESCASTTDGTLNAPDSNSLECRRMTRSSIRPIRSKNKVGKSTCRRKHRQRGQVTTAEPISLAEKEVSVLPPNASDRNASSSPRASTSGGSPREVQQHQSPLNVAANDRPKDTNEAVKIQEDALQGITPSATMVQPKKRKAEKPLCFKSKSKKTSDVPEKSTADSTRSPKADIKSKNTGNRGKGRKLGSKNKPQKIFDSAKIAMLEIANVVQTKKVQTKGTAKKVKGRKRGSKNKAKKTPDILQTTVFESSSSISDIASNGTEKNKKTGRKVGSKNKEKKSEMLQTTIPEASASGISITPPGTPHKIKGRKPGSKNKTKKQADSDQTRKPLAMEVTPSGTEKKKRGRKAGTKNKAKGASHTVTPDTRPCVTHVTETKGKKRGRKLGSKNRPKIKFGCTAMTTPARPGVSTALNVKDRNRVSSKGKAHDASKVVPVITIHDATPEAVGDSASKKGGKPGQSSQDAASTWLKCQPVTMLSYPKEVISDAACNPNAINSWLTDYAKMRYLQQREENHTQQALMGKEALVYVSQVEATFRSRPTIYNRFLCLLRDSKCNLIPLDSLVEKVKELFVDHPHLISGFAQFLPRANQHLLKPENAMSNSTKPDTTAPTEVTLLHTAKNLIKYAMSKAVQTAGTSSICQTAHNLKHHAKSTEPKDRPPLSPSKTEELTGSSQWEKSLDSLDYFSPVVGEIPNLFEEANEPIPGTASQDISQGTSSHAVSQQAVRHMETGSTGEVSRKSTQVLTGERSVNRVTLLGRAGRTAEVRGSAEHPVTVFPLATSISIKRPDGTYEQQTEWHRISIFRPGLRDIAATLVEAGDRVFVSGAIRYNMFKNEAGETVYSTNIIADDVIRIAKKLSKSSDYDKTQ